VGGVVRSLASGASEESVTLPPACAALRGAQFVKVVP
jgi:hypothetical protein